MSKYKIGDKVVMEITDKVEVMGDPWYLLSNATSIYVPYLDKAAEPISTYIEQARSEAWELARKIVVVPKEGGCTGRELFEIFNTATISKIFSLTYPEAAAKVEAWEKAKSKPQKTMVQDFFEKYPNALIELPPTCPYKLGYCKKTTITECNRMTCVECWNRPLEQIGGDDDE